MELYDLNITPLNVLNILKQYKIYLLLIRRNLIIHFVIINT